MLDSKIRTDVFMSSTSIDLPEYREAVMKTLLGLGLFPIGMETWPKTGENPVDKCKRMVDESEIYIGIYAYRYGWQPDGYAGKSITELEYEWAGEKGIPRLCFIMSPKHPWPDERRENDKQKELDAFKARVKADEVGFFTTPDDLAKQIAVALAGVVQVKPNLTPYHNWLHTQSHKSGLLGVLQARDASNSDVKSVDIESVYTPLFLHHQVERHDDGSPILPDRPLGEIDRKERDLFPLSALEATNAYPRLVMLGDPGCGKSTFVNFLALCLTGHFLSPDAGWLDRLHADGWEHGAYLPIRIILRDFATFANDSTVDSFIKHITHELSAWGMNETIIKGILHYIEKGQALIMFDGLDEVPPDKRELVRDAIHNIIERYHPKNRYLITCRILSYTQPEWQLRNMDAIETFAPFNEEQITHFVNAWYTALIAMRDIDTLTAQARINDLIGGLNTPALRDIAGNPMLLTVMAIVHNHTGTLPRESARLYHECVELLMEKWRPRDFVTLREKMKFNNDGLLYEMIWQIAFTAHNEHAERDGVADITQTEIIGIVEKYVKDDWNLAREFCEYVESRAGLLIGRGNRGASRIFTFPHRTFQEFLAACYLANVANMEELAPDLAKRGAGWREVLLLATGYLVFVKNSTRDALRAVRSILESLSFESDSDWRAVWLAGEMLAKIGVDNALAPNTVNVGKQVIQQTKDLLVQLIEGAHLPPVERAKAGQVLSQLGDPRRGVNTITINGLTLPDVVWCLVPAGDFIMGDDNAPYDDEKPAHTLHLDDFYMSRYLVTYAQYQAFENAPDFGNETWWKGFPDEYKGMSTNQAFPFANHPQERVSWYGAMAFCRWLTHHINEAGVPMTVWDMKAKKYIEMPYPTMKITLPSEAEYEKMARGEKGLIYPYGNDYDPNKGNTDDTGIGMTSAVGLFPDGESPYRVLDASGNVWTWTRSIFKNYKYNSNDGREDEVENGENARSLRGGSWDDSSVNARASYRYFSDPNSRNDNIGFFVVCRPY
ncbi:MAG: SUMF1/EgtB/PvdO family nonheme iron enzyme [bacterium]|nr:SUMF1/EgtB/PvdO family nonheme iron enzyme [bacterium]